MMKNYLFIFTLLSFLSLPVLALEYEGKNLDGRQIPAKAYYQETGGVYDVKVIFKGNKATLFFDDGGQTTIRLKHSVISDLNNIQGVGQLGYIPLGNRFSIGLESSQTTGNWQNNHSQMSNPLWRLSLSEQDLEKF